MHLSSPHAHRLLWVFGLLPLTALGFGIVCAQSVFDSTDAPEERLTWALVTISCLLAAASGFAYMLARPDRFGWRIVDGALIGSWTPDDDSARLPFRGGLRTEVATVSDAETGDVEVARAVHDSAQFGTVRLLEKPRGFKPGLENEWAKLDLRGCAWEPLHGDEVTLPSGWTGAERVAMGLAFGAVGFLAAALLPALGLVVFLVAWVAFALWVLERTFVTVQLRRTPEGLAARRRVGARAWGGWEPMFVPDVLDLTRYPRIEWSTRNGTSLAVRGGPRGLGPKEALLATEWMRQPPEDATATGRALSGHG